MSSYGVLDTGFRKKLFQTIKDEIAAAEKATFGENFNTADDDAPGQLNGIMADKFAELWEVAELVYSAFDPSSATGVPQDNLGKIRGILREDATNSTVNVSVYSSAGTTVAIGDTIQDSAGNVWVATEEVVIGAGDTEIVAYEAQNTGRVQAFAGTVYKNISTTGATFVAASILSDAGPYNLTGSPEIGISVAGAATVTITLTGGAAETATTVAAQIQSAFTNLTASNSGGAVLLTVSFPSPTAKANTIQVVTDDLNIFDTDQKYGSPANLLDAVPGQELETDSEYRISSQQKLQSASSATYQAVLDNVANVEGVTSVFLLENDTDSTDGNGLPAHSLEIIALGGDDADIAETIFRKKPVGTQAYSGASGADEITEVVQDSAGNDHTIQFSRPTSVPVTALNVDITVDDSFGGGDETTGIAGLKLALVEYFDAFGAGQDIIWTQLIRAVLEVQGVLDVPDLEYNAGSGLVSSNTSINPRSLASLESSAITVTVL